MIDLDFGKMIDADPGIPAQEILVEACALEEYLKALDDRLSNIQHQTRLRLEAELRHSSPQIAADPKSWYHKNINKTVSKIIPRFFVGAAVVAVWALYEASVEEVAGYIKRKERISLALKDIKGDFNDQSRKYFAHVLQFPLPYKDTDFVHLSRLNMLRVCFAHDNGTLRGMTPEKRNEIRKKLINLSGVEIVDDKLFVSMSFVLKAFRSVEKCLETLLNSLMARYAEKRNTAQKKP